MTEDGLFLQVRSARAMSIYSLLEELKGHGIEVDTVLVSPDLWPLAAAEIESGTLAGFGDIRSADDQRPWPNTVVMVKDGCSVARFSNVS